jgi:hypothetical protein
MSKGIVTDYPEICFICGRPSEAEHHLVFGTAGRELSEKDGLKVPVCNDCHNMGDILCRIHGNPMAERMSKIIGQLAGKKNTPCRRQMNLQGLLMKAGRKAK